LDRECRNNKVFDRSISRERKKKITDTEIVRRSEEDWDCQSSSSSRSGRSIAEDKLVSSSTLLSEDTQEDSGFHSCGMLSLDSSSSSCNRQSRGKTTGLLLTGDDVTTENTGGNSKTRKIKRCESMDFKDIMLHSRQTQRGLDEWTEGTS